MFYEIVDIVSLQNSLIDIFININICKKSYIYFNDCDIFNKVLIFQKMLIF